MIRPRAGTKLRARAPVDQTTSTVRAARSTVAGAVIARCATIDCPPAGSRLDAASASGAGLPPPASIVWVILSPVLVLAYEEPSEIVRKPTDQIGFAVHPHRWVVESCVAWLGRNRRLAKDFEATIASAQAFLYAASVTVLLRRLARPARVQGRFCRSQQFPSRGGKGHERAPSVTGLCFQKPSSPSA